MPPSGAASAPKIQTVRRRNPGRTKLASEPTMAPQTPASSAPGVGASRYSSMPKFTSHIPTRSPCANTSEKPSSERQNPIESPRPNASNGASLRPATPNAVHSAVVAGSKRPAANDDSYPGPANCGMKPKARNDSATNPAATCTLRARRNGGSVEFAPRRSGSASDIAEHGAARQG